jgi:hypothetical protein
VVPELARRLSVYCGAKGLTESAAVQAAIEQYLDRGEKDNAIILRRLDRLGRASAQHQRDLEVVSEAFAIFVRRWVATLPELAPAEREVVDRLSAKRYQTFLDILARSLADPSRYLARTVVRDDVPPTSAPTR